ncbi:uncharacterized protein LOC135848420 [Planococcus citri]|uniref:uncharacterized protein LOC135848420 n=1 Tax=Planococcus citri TaxID=170843 RepID=UPI0031F9D4D1
MNSGQGVISCFFIIIALNALHLAMSLYEPLYVTKSPMEEKYYLIFDVKRDSPNGPCVIRSPDPEDDILLACPKADYPDALEILGGVGKMANVVDFCQMSIESHVFMSKDKKKNSVIGFLISTPNKQPSNPFKDVPENHSVCGLIYFKFDYKLNRIRSVRYTLTAGKLLTSEINEDRNVEYQKNINIFKYDIDNLYALVCISILFI